MPGDGETIRLQLTRSEFEDIIRYPVQRAVELTRATLADAGVTDPGDLKALYLTGGSSRVPFVQEEIKKLGPVATLDDPKMVVAQGAISAVGPIVTGLHTNAAPGVSRQAGPQAAPQARPGQGQQFPQPGGASQYSPAGSAGSTGTDDAPRKKKPVGMIIGAILGVLVLVVALVIGLRAFGGSSTSEPTEPRKNPDEETAAPANDTEVAQDSEAPENNNQTGKDVLEALPQSLKDNVENCILRGTSYSDLSGASISCDAKLTGDSVPFFKQTSPYDKPKLIFAANTDDAGREKAFIEQGRYNNNTNDEPLEGDGGNAKAIATAINDSSAELHYANSETGIYIESRDFASPEQAKEWLEYHNLL